MFKRGSVVPWACMRSVIFYCGELPPVFPKFLDARARFVDQGG